MILWVALTVLVGLVALWSALRFELCRARLNVAVANNAIACLSLNKSNDAIRRLTDISGRLSAELVSLGASSEFSARVGELVRYHVRALQGDHAEVSVLRGRFVGVLGSADGVIEVPLARVVGDVSEIPVIRAVDVLPGEG